MEFTYSAYEKLIVALKNNDYYFCDYFNYHQYEKKVILRHDIDMDIEKAVRIAKIENAVGVKATYFVLISSDFYNVFSKKSLDLLNYIKKLGHNIGLHFDEEKYKSEDILSAIEYELDILEKFLGDKIRSVSMHRPSEKTLSSNYVIKSGAVVNSYATEFFEKFKYVSDSRRNWREDIVKIVNSNQYSCLHILTHPIWYSEQERTAKDVLRSFCHHKILECYDSLGNNIRDLRKILSEEDLY